MKILPSYNNEKKFIERAIKNCKDILGEEVCYDIEILKSIKDKTEDFLEFLKKSNKTEIEKSVVSCGGTKNLVTVSAVKETKIYKTILNFYCDLDVIIKLMEVNDLKSTKGFDFATQQIDNVIQKIIKRLI